MQFYTWGLLTHPGGVSMEITEEDILSYMEQFPVDWEQAIAELKELTEFWAEQQEEAMQEVYEGIIRGQH